MLEAAFEIASHPQRAGISLGEADLRSQTGALEAGLDWARGRIVNAAVAAGLPRPPQSVYPHVRDARGPRARRAGAAASSATSAAAAIHPDQLPVIEQAYLPTKAEVESGPRRRSSGSQAAGVGTLAGRRVRRRGDARCRAAGARAGSALRHVGLDELGRRDRGGGANVSADDEPERAVAAAQLDRIAEIERLAVLEHRAMRCGERELLLDRDPVRGVVDVPELVDVGASQRPRSARRRCSAGPAA